MLQGRQLCATWAERIGSESMGLVDTESGDTPKRQVLSQRPSQTGKKVRDMERNRKEKENRLKGPEIQRAKKAEGGRKDEQESNEL